MTEVTYKRSYGVDTGYVEWTRELDAQVFILTPGSFKAHWTVTCKVSSICKADSWHTQCRVEAGIGVTGVDPFTLGSTELGQAEAAV